MSEFKCQKCGKKATINLQHNWTIFRISRGEFDRIKEWNDDENSFYCDICAVKEELI